jgi:general secretion pathway protein B
MSYILDALKKAERERGIAQVPTLTTVHDTKMTIPHSGQWIFAGACLACLVAIVWIGIALLRTTVKPVSSSIDAGNNGRTPGQSSTPVTTPPQSSPEAIVPAKAGTALSAPVVSTGVPLTDASPNNLAAKKTATEDNPIFAPGELPRQPEIPAPLKNTSVHPQSALNKATPATTEQTPQSDASQSSPISFQESMATMNMTILMYAEAKSERIVFVNDRKYMEGDYIDGRYLLESITPEGAVLSYRGERLTLRPRAK